jgi:hypothetical protein
MPRQILLCRAALCGKDIGWVRVAIQVGQPSLYQSLAIPRVRSDSDFGTLVLGVMDAL